MTFLFSGSHAKNAHCWLYVPVWPNLRTHERESCFCFLGVNIECLDEFLAIDISAPAFANRDPELKKRGSSARTSALESVMQLLHLMFTKFHFEESAFRRAKQQTLMDYYAYTRDLAVS